jgi:hypothetical protein
MDSMRRYFFQNFYVAGIRNGIQAGHAAEIQWAELAKLALAGQLSDKGRAKLEMMIDFALNHGTWILLTGGDHSTLQELFDFLDQNPHSYPVERFLEPGLNNTITSLTIVIPERLYDDVANDIGRAYLKAGATSDSTFQGGWCLPLDLAKQAADRNYSSWELDFLRRKAACGLAS